MSGCSVCGEKLCAKGLCRLHYVMQWQRENPERTKENKRRSAARNIEKRRAKARTPEERERKRLADAASHQKHKEERNAKQRAYARANRERANERLREWKKANPDSVKADTHNRRARLRGAVGKHTGEEVRALFAKQRGRCAACRIKLDGFHKDHVHPLSAGGSNDIGNIQLLCPDCNMTKGARSNTAFMQSRGMLL